MWESCKGSDIVQLTLDKSTWVTKIEIFLTHTYLLKGEQHSDWKFCNCPLTFYHIFLERSDTLPARNLLLNARPIRTPVKDISFFILRSLESLRWSYAIGWRPSSYVVPRATSFVRGVLASPSQQLPQQSLPNLVLSICMVRRQEL